jgi:hypothetical protein
MEQYRELHGSEPREDAPQFVQPPAGGGGVFGFGQCLLVGGSVGSVAGPCTFAYAVYQLTAGATAGAPLIASQQPLYHNRPALGRMEFVPTATQYPGVIDQLDVGAGLCIILRGLGAPLLWAVCCERILPAVRACAEG